MIEAEWFILNLRSQVRNLQSLLNYLEGCDNVTPSEYSYSQARLHEVMKRLNELNQLSSKRSRDTEDASAQWN